MNHTLLALIPKVPTPTKVTDFRPISCCNVLFKCISKILANRIKGCLQSLINLNQSAFIPGRSIADNILLTHELMHNYHLDRGEPRSAFKIDIQKAYDTVDWNFLRVTLSGFGFPQKMIGWIMECVTTTSFSISLNGASHGHFRGKRGLRQGDPLSPYLFTLVMEILTLILQRKVRETDGFKYHRSCSEMKLINLCFADDLFLFSHGDVSSAKIIMDSLNEFRDVSGLTPSLPKSTAYFCNVLNHTKLGILQVLPFEEGRLPVKYLGVPLVPSRLVYKDCKELIAKVEARVSDWKNKSLSIAGRLQLVKSVLGSMHVYWASVFILPTRVLLEIQQIMRNFLWSNGEFRRGKAKVAWEAVCLPKSEGGLGIRQLDLFNQALMVSQLWKLLMRKESLWVAWTQLHKIRDRSFWTIPCRGSMSWGWRKLLQLRPVIRDFIWHKIGDGQDTSIWYDKWCDLSPIADLVSTRDMFRADLSLSSRLADIVESGTLVWPPVLGNAYPDLISIPSPTFNTGMQDSLEWRDRSGSVHPFSVRAVWNAIRPYHNPVPWADVVWFSHNIPKHAFLVWLAIKGKLRTQDVLRAWDVSPTLVSHCTLCETQPDSHAHLFFECPYARQVWFQVRGQAGLQGSPPCFSDIVGILIPFAHRRSSASVIAKLVLAAAMYFIWRERNERLYTGAKRTVNVLVANILADVRSRLLSCRFKSSRAALDLLKNWNIPESLLI